MNKPSASRRRWMLALAMSLAIGSAAAASPAAPRYAQLAGHWAVQQSMWTTPGAPAVVDHGTATYALVLGGRDLRQELRIASSKPFEGLGYIGQDAVTGRYFSSWMDTNFSGMILARGSYDAASRTYTFTGEMAGNDGLPVPVREVMRIADSDHFVYEYYETRNGKEALAVSLQYTRMD